MKNICLLVQGGKFLLGIHAEAVAARTDWAEAAQQRKAGEKIFQLSALLSRQAGGAVPPDAVCLELRGQHEPFCLLVDRIVDEAEVINPPGPPPPACPPLAARLCPQVTIWGDTPVLLLNPAQVIPVAEELGEGIGLLAEEPEPAFAASEPESEKEEEDDPFFPVTKQAQPVTAAFFPEEEEAEFSEPEGPVAALAEEEAEEEPPAADFVDDEEPAEPATASVAPSAALAEEQSTPPAPEPKKENSSVIDEETFKKVMSWTIARFKQSRTGEELHLGTDQLPPELSGMVEEKGLSRSIIQYLIDQIVLRCKETESAGRRLPGEKKYAK